VWLVRDDEVAAELVVELEEDAWDLALDTYPPGEMAELDIEAIKLGRTSISFENTNVKGSANTIAENRVYGINSNHMDFKVLRDGNFIWNPDGFERVGLTLNKALYFWVFCNLTVNLPSAHLVMTNISSG